jgi:hypothetical protein
MKSAPLKQVGGRGGAEAAKVAERAAEAKRKGWKLLPELWHGGHTMPPEPGKPLGQPRSEHIGEGEGTAYHGTGLNVATTRQVAEDYRVMGDWSPKEVKGATAYLKLRDPRFLQRTKDPNKIVDEAVGWGYEPKEKRGSVYKMKYPDAYEEEFLDWQRLMSDQPDYIKEGAAKLGYAPETIAHMKGADFLRLLGEKDLPRFEEKPRPKGMSEAEWLEEEHGRYVDYQNEVSARATKILKKAGIKGTQFPMETLHGKGARGFVLFIPENAQNLAKYGFAPFLAGGLGTGVAYPEETPEQQQFYSEPGAA